MRLTVLFDGSCGMCRRCERAGRRLDWFGLIEWVPSESPAAARFGIPPEELGRALHAVGGKSVSAGFAAVKRILLRLPPVYLALAGMVLLEPWSALLPLVFYSPLFAPLGEGIYARVARGRRCEL